MLIDELRRLHEHAARAAGRVKDLAAVRLDDLHHQPDHRARGKELAAALAFGHGELAEEVLVDLSEHIALGIGRDIGEVLQQLRGDAAVLLGAGQAKVLVLGQHALQLGLVLLDRLHRLLDRLGDVLLVRQVEQVVVAGVVRQIEAALFDGNSRQLALGALALVLAVLGLRIAVSCLR